jgi:glycosyltransferase involved in cell wall biosynthesis
MALRVVIQQPALPLYRVPLMRQLAARPGIDLTIVHGQVAGLANGSADGLRTISHRQSLPWLPLKSLEWQHLPLRFLSKRHCDVLVLTWNIRHMSMVPFTLAAHAAGIPVVLWGHGYSKADRLGRRFWRWNAARLGSAVVLYNNATADEIVRAGIPRERIFTALNTIDSSPAIAQREALERDPQRLAEFRRAHNIPAPAPHGGPTLLFVSRLMASNRVDVLVRAAATLRAKRPSTRVLIVGGGEDLASLKQLVASLNLNECVTFHGAVYGDEQIAPFFCASDLFVYPSNVGLSIIHAMAYALPAIIGDDLSRHNPEVEALSPQPDEPNGATFRHDDPNDCARVIDELCNAPDRLATMRRNALSTATERFTVERMVNGLESAIRYAAFARAGSAHSAANARNPTKTPLTP